jgi:hypothetical protein
MLTMAEAVLDEHQHVVRLASYTSRDMPSTST